jgi:hypothetical protein
MDDATFDLASSRIKELNELCSSVDLSLSALQEKIGILDESDIQKISSVLYTELCVWRLSSSSESLYEDYPLLHTVCRNRNVTVEIMKYLMDTFPNPKGEWSSCKFRPKHATGIQKLETFINWKLLDLRQVQRYYMRLHTYNLFYYVLEVCM